MMGKFVKAIREMMNKVVGGTISGVLGAKI